MLLQLQQLQFKKKQECIPVGCVPSAAVAVSPRGRGAPQCRADIPREQTPPGSRHPSMDRQTPLKT